MRELSPWVLNAFTLARVVMLLDGALSILRGHYDRATAVLLLALVTSDAINARR